MTEGPCVLSNINSTALILPLFWGFSSGWARVSPHAVNTSLGCFNLYFILRFQFGIQQHGSSGKSFSKGNIFRVSGGFWAVPGWH